MTYAIDHTPDTFNPNSYRNKLGLKRRLLDQFIKPISTRSLTQLKKLSHLQKTSFSFEFDRLVFGERGTSTLCLKRYVEKFSCLKSSRVLIQGCGLGQESIEWSKLGAAACVGIDKFNFKNGWKIVSDSIDSADISFIQGDICDTTLPDNSFDIISSGAVWEHVSNFDQLLQESVRLMKPDGIVASSFGPLWFTFGGDHFSGFDELSNGYNHLLLSKSDYLDWVDSVPIQDNWATSKDSYFEIRRHIHEGMFSYLKPREYIESIDENFERSFTMVVISPEALKFKTTFPDKWKKLLDVEGVTEEDLLIKTLIVILKQH